MCGNENDRCVIARVLIVGLPQRVMGYDKKHASEEHVAKL